MSRQMRAGQDCRQTAWALLAAGLTVWTNSTKQRANQQPEGQSNHLRFLRGCSSTHCDAPIHSLHTRLPSCRCRSQSPSAGARAPTPVERVASSDMMNTTQHNMNIIRQDRARQGSNCNIMLPRRWQELLLLMYRGKLMAIDGKHPATGNHQSRQQLQGSCLAEVLHTFLRSFLTASPLSPLFWLGGGGLAQPHSLVTGSKFL